jgi:tetratricopeptide (TPR) repeat protein
MLEALTIWIRDQTAVGMRVTVQFQEVKTMKPEAKPAPAPVTVAPPAPPPAPLPVAPPPNVAARPGDAEEHHRKGRDLLQKGQYRAAIDQLSQAIAAKPDLALAWNARGYAYLILRDPASAIQNFEAFLTFRRTNGLPLSKALKSSTSS